MRQVTKIVGWRTELWEWHKGGNPVEENLSLCQASSAAVVSAGESSVPGSGECERGVQKGEHLERPIRYQSPRGN